MVGHCAERRREQRAKRQVGDPENGVEVFTASADPPVSPCAKMLRNAGARLRGATRGAGTGGMNARRADRRSRGALCGEARALGDAGAGVSQRKILRALPCGSILVLPEFCNHDILLSKRWDNTIYAECWIMPSWRQPNVQIGAKTGRSPDWNLG